MHDIDGTLLRGVQSEWENDNEWETDNEWEWETPMDSEEALAQELLEIQDEAEMEQFLGNVLKRASNMIPPGLKKAARFLWNTAKPHLKQAYTGFGNDLINQGSDAAKGWVDSSASKLFGELPSNSPVALEVARKLVQATQAAGKQISQLPNPSPSAVKSIVTQAARRYLPPPSSPASAKRGTWVRQGDKIILYGI